MKFNLNIKQFMKLKAAQVFNFDAQVVTWLLSVSLQPSSMTWSWLKRLAIGCHKQSYSQVVNNVFEAWVTEERQNDNNMLCDKIATNKSNEILHLSCLTMSIQDYTLVMSFVAVVVNGADDKTKF